MSKINPRIIIILWRNISLGAREYQSINNPASLRVAGGKQMESSNRY